MLPEALEKWPVSLFESLLPRHLQIINEINFQFLTEVRGVWGDGPAIQKMSIYEEGWTKMLRMSNLAIIGSHKVNGVAAIHSDILKRELFKDFNEFYAEKGEKDFIVNMTNGVTPRRWMYCCNRKLAYLIAEWLGSDLWVKDLDKMKDLEKHITNPKLINEWKAVKLFNKQQLAKYVLENCGVQLEPETMLFDVQVKRIHEYKRQLMNILYVTHRYLKLKRMNANERANVQARACMIGGKAAPAYTTAKTIIRMANNLSKIINNDNDVNKQLKVGYV